MLEVAQHVGRVGDRDRLVDRAREGDAGVDHVDGAEAEASLIWFSLPSWEAGKTWISYLPLVRFLISSAAHTRLGVVGLGDLVDVRPFELGLGGGRQGRKRKAGGADC